MFIITTNYLGDKFTQLLLKDHYGLCHCRYVFYRHNCWRTIMTSCLLSNGDMFLQAQLLKDHYGLFHLPTEDMFFTGTIAEGPLWPVPLVHRRHVFLKAQLLKDHYGLCHLSTAKTCFFTGTFAEGPLWPVPLVHWRHDEGRDFCWHRVRSHV